MTTRIDRPARRKLLGWLGAGAAGLPAGLPAILGAASGVGGEGTGGTTAPGKVQGTLTYGLKGGTPAQLQAVDEAVARFRQQFPEVNVQADHFFGGDKNWLDVFLAKRAADSLPDTFGIIEYNQGIVWAYQGTVQALDPFIKNDRAFRLDEYQQGPVNAYRAGGKLWGVPQSPNPVMIYANRTQLERTGQQPPTNEWNTDQFLDTVKRATTGVGSEQVVWGYAFNRRWSLMLGWLAAFGGAMTSPDRSPLHDGHPGVPGRPAVRRRPDLPPPHRAPTGRRRGRRRGADHALPGAVQRRQRGVHHGRHRRRPRLPAGHRGQVRLGRPSPAQRPQGAGLHPLRGRLVDQEGHQRLPRGPGSS